MTEVRITLVSGRAIYLKGEAAKSVDTNATGVTYEVKGETTKFLYAYPWHQVCELRVQE